MFSFGPRARFRLKPWEYVTACKQVTECVISSLALSVTGPDLLAKLKNYMDEVGYLFISLNMIIPVISPLHAIKLRRFSIFTEDEGICSLKIYSIRSLQEIPISTRILILEKTLALTREYLSHMFRFQISLDEIDTLYEENLKSLRTLKSDIELELPLDTTTYSVVIRIELIN